MAHEVAVVVSEMGVLPEIVTRGVVIPPGIGRVAKYWSIGRPRGAPAAGAGARARALRTSRRAVAERMLRFLNEVTEPASAGVTA